MSKVQAAVQNLCVIGVGLIGSSIARAARTTEAAAHITLFDADEAVRRRCVAVKMADRVADDLAAAVINADLIILATPVGACESVARAIAPHVKNGATVSDTGSVKLNVTQALRTALPNGVHVIPAHPVAGTEHSGPDAGFATLFQKRWCILTPPAQTNTAAIHNLKLFWQKLGAYVEEMDAAHHDMVLAITSHIPHLIAYNIVGTAAHLEHVAESEVIKFSAGGFRDFTRIAASDPVMWRDIFLNNRDAVLEMLGRFMEDLSVLQRAIRFGDGDTLFNHFTRTRAIRREIIAAGQETAATDFGRQDQAKHDERC